MYVLILVSVVVMDALALVIVLALAVVAVNVTVGVLLSVPLDVREVVLTGVVTVAPQHVPFVAIVVQAAVPQIVIRYAMKDVVVGVRAAVVAPVLHYAKAPAQMLAKTLALRLVLECVGKITVREDAPIFALAVVLELVKQVALALVVMVALELV
jgi:hypothetical protein